MNRGMEDREQYTCVVCTWLLSCYHGFPLKIRAYLSVENCHCVSTSDPFPVGKCATAFTSMLCMFQ